MLVLSGLVFSSFGLILASLIKQLENFAGVINFVIFPLFFTSSALYPIWKLEESSLLLSRIASFNPFTLVTEACRFALEAKVDWQGIGLLGLIFVVLQLVIALLAQKNLVFKA